MGGRTRKRAVAATVGEERLSVACRFALAQMAEHALDSPGRNSADPVGVYWGGHGLLALEVFGFDTPTTRRHITRIIRELENHKLVRVYDPNVGGRRAYQLLPENPRGGDI